MRSILAICLALCLLAPTASAIPYLDLNGDQTGPVWLDGDLFTGADSHTWTFDLDNDVLEYGDINPGDDILSAILKIEIWDDEPNDTHLLELEVASTQLDGNYVFVGEIDQGFFAADVISFVSDHVLTLKISHVLGDFLVKYAAICGEYRPQDPGEPGEPVVPEPATLSLLGLGLAGLGARRRFSA